MSDGHNSTLGAALLAGGIAISLNTLTLKAPDLIPLGTAKGGLLRLMSSYAGPILRNMGLSKLWNDFGAPPVNSSFFQTGFHIVIGLLMALFYAFAVEPNISGRPIFKGFVYGLVVWLANAAILLPATGEGFAGANHLSLTGMTWFAVSHMIFFVVLALLYGIWRPSMSAALDKISTCPLRS